MSPKYTTHHNLLFIFPFLAVMEKLYEMPVGETGCEVCLNDVTRSTHLHFPVIISIRSVHLTTLSLKTCHIFPDGVDSQPAMTWRGILIF